MVTTQSSTQSFVCQAPACGRVTTRSTRADDPGAGNPKCVCGSETKKVYTTPQLTVLTQEDGLRLMGEPVKVDCG
jgi:hypothetical protein